MKHNLFLLLVIIPVLCISCRKDDYISDRPFSFNLFLFSKNGTDLLNPSQAGFVPASDISVETQFVGKPLSWKIRSTRRYMENSDVVIDLAGFFCYDFYTPELAEGLDELKNTQLECVIHIEGLSDSRVVFYFDKNGRVYRHEVNGVRVETVNYTDNNIKLMY